MSLYLDAVTTVQTRLDRFQRIPKSILFAGGGFLFAFLGSAIGFTINPFRAGSFLHLGWWDAVIGLGIGFSIAVLQSWYLARLEVAAKDLRKAVVISSLGGLAGGFSLAAVKVGLGFPLSLVGLQNLAHVPAWTAEGMVIALAVSRAIPNLKLIPAGLAGLGAGFLGGLMTSGAVSGGLLWVAFADGFKGLFIGLSIALVERLAREAWLVVKRDGSLSPAAAGRGLTLLQGPPTVLLGETPVVIGTTPECAVVVRGLVGEPRILAEVRLERGKILLRNPDGGHEETLRAGQTLRYGDVTLEVGAKIPGGQG